MVLQGVFLLPTAAQRAFAGAMAALFLLECICMAWADETIKPSIDVKAQPFALHDVKLLDGPFLAARGRDAAYMLSLEPDRLLARFRQNAGLEPKGKNYGGWEAESLSGHTLGHYLSACALMADATGDERFLRRARYIVSELMTCQRAAGDGFVAGFPDGRKAFAEVARGEIRAKPFNLNGIWSPFYTWHKLFAGLRDVHRLCSSADALTIQTGLAGWIEKNLAGVDNSQMQQVLTCEFGGMNEALVDLAADTGDRRWLALSYRFDHKAVFEPLARGEDCLNGLHANTQAPKFLGLARRYEAAGDPTDLRTAEFFFDRVANHHSYTTGGNSETEYFAAPDKLSRRLSTRNTETCNTYNMLKLARQLWMLDPRARLAEYCERAVWNHILASQHPQSGMVTYFVPLRGGFFKEYTTPLETFTCCLGTGMENHAKYGDSVYFHQGDLLWVNQFLASELNWRSQGIVLRQETLFPQGDTVEFAVRCDRPSNFTLRLRHPSWVAGAIEVKLNGRLFDFTSRRGEYFDIRRDWRDGDRLSIRLPMTLRCEAMPDDPRRVAVFYGPILLAGALGRQDDTAWKEQDYVPVMITGGRELADWIKPVEGRPCTFRTSGAGRPRDVTLSPYYQTHDVRYAVYWDLVTEQEWAERQAEGKREGERQKAWDARLIDRVKIGNAESESAHNLKGDGMEAEDYNGRPYRLSRGKWFSYEVAVDPETSSSLVCTWWGRERAGSRRFEVRVDSKTLVTVANDGEGPDRFLDAVYPIPEELTRGKKKVTVEFAALDDKWAGGIFDLRVVRQ